jgi:hypothetical protein
MKNVPYVIKTAGPERSGRQIVITLGGRDEGAEAATRVSAANLDSRRGHSQRNASLEVIQ